MLGKTLAMLAKTLATLSLTALLGLSVAAQNPVPNADFEGGITGWTLVSFNDPLGTTGVRATDVNGTTDTSQAIFADFQTLTSVRSATYDSTKFKLQQGTYPITADVSWEKLVTTPVPSPSVNRVEFRIRDATTNVQVFNQRITVPNQTGLIERATFTNTVTIPANGDYILQVFLRHSNLAGIPFFCHVDDIAIGEFGGTCSAGGSAATGSTLDLKLMAPAATGKSYFVGTSLGRGPIIIDTRQINLTADPVLVLSTSGLAPAIFMNYSGTVVATGNTANLVIPAVPALAGVKVYSAFVTIDAAAPSGVLTMSNTNCTEIQ